ncbi:hypothetical protein CP49_13555 [Bradyrhizobium valentinum]|uniref:Uncharacterized protein n=2 Tax=Bradyrhizobium valentinum TaxID=1518501 RepID=A0A0R3KCC8_9BRAD|nr:hypothetical protein CP49_13555 [Bradyrhizobium valentinum]
MADHADRIENSKMHSLRLILLAVVVVICDTSAMAAQPTITIAQLERAPELDCATKLKGLIIDIDELLAKNPRNLVDVYEVFHRHFPINRCGMDEVSLIVKTSRYFRSISMNGPKMHVYSLNSETASSRGVAVSFGLTDAGELVFPFAIWSPSFL